MLCAEHPGTCSAGEVINACRCMYGRNKGSTDFPLRAFDHRVVRYLAMGIIVANLVFLDPCISR